MDDYERGELEALRTFRSRMFRLAEGGEKGTIRNGENPALHRAEELVYQTERMLIEAAMIYEQEAVSVQRETPRLAEEYRRAALVCRRRALGDDQRHGHNGHKRKDQ